jgi:hypothetical protein
MENRFSRSQVARARRMSDMMEKESGHRRCPLDFQTAERRI